jgi:hypothetical protein
VNPYEARNRARRVHALVEAIDDVSLAAGRSATAATVASWSPAVWAKWAEYARINAPSPTTIDAVIDVYRNRELRRSA